MKASEAMRVLRLSCPSLTKHVYKGHLMSNAFTKIEELNINENSKS